MTRNVNLLYHKGDDDINSVNLIGRLTKDIDLRFAAGSGKAIGRFNLAVQRPIKAGEADFITCISFGNTAETMAKYLKKGDPIALTGRIQTGSYENQQGVKVYTTDVVVDRFEFISGNKNNENQQQQQQQNNYNSDYNYGDMAPVDGGDIPF